MDCPRAEPTDQRGVGDQKQAGLAQQRLGQIEPGRERAAGKRQEQGHSHR